VAKHHLSSSVGHSADADQIAAATGASTDIDPHYLQSTGFVLAPEGTVIGNGRWPPTGLGPPSPSSAPGRHDSPLFEPTLRQIPDMIGSLPDEPCVHLDRAYDLAATRDLLKELGYGHEIAPKCIPAPDPGTWSSSTPSRW